MTAAAPKTVNMERKCFKCNERIYLNPDVRKKDNPMAFDPLDEPFDQYTATEPPKFHMPNCKGQVLERAPVAKPYNYEEPRQVFPDERPEFIAKKADQDKKKEATIGGIATSEFRELIEDVKYMKGLLEAVIKAFDSALKTNPSNTGNLLFTQASNMPRKGDEETKTLEEDTEKIQEEQLGEEDDTDEKVSEYEQEEKRESENEPLSNN